MKQTTLRRTRSAQVHKQISAAVAQKERLIVPTSTLVGMPSRICGDLRYAPDATKHQNQHGDEVSALQKEKKTIAGLELSI